jgi:hypothetical protein
MNTKICICAFLLGHPLGLIDKTLNIAHLFSCFVLPMYVPTQLVHVGNREPPGYV